MDFKVGDKVKILATHHVGRYGIIDKILDDSPYPIGVELATNDEAPSEVRWFRPKEIEKA